jgi:hypothetical protein
VIIKTINFIIKPRTLNDKPHCAWNFKKPKWHKYKEEIDLKIPDTQFNFQGEAPGKNVINTAHLCFILQNSIYLRVKFQNINNFGPISWQNSKMTGKQKERKQNCWGTRKMYKHGEKKQES